MSIKTQVPLTLITSSAAEPRVAAGPLGRLLTVVQDAFARVIVGPLIHRSLHNQDALLENKALLRRDPHARLEASVLRAAYREIEPVEARHLELVYLAEGADLYTEGRPWAVHYAPASLVLINRSTRVAVGPAAPQLIARLNQHARGV